MLHRVTVLPQKTRVHTHISIIQYKSKFPKDLKLNIEELRMGKIKPGRDVDWVPTPIPTC